MVKKYHLEDILGRVITGVANGAHQTLCFRSMKQTLCVIVLIRLGVHLWPSLKRYPKTGQVLRLRFNMKSLEWALLDEQLIKRVRLQQKKIGRSILMKTKTTTNEFETYMERKIGSSFSIEREMNEAILSLYKKGYLEVSMESEEPLISISQAGKSMYASMLLSHMTPMGEA
ncbi:MAG TPA: hypothetical protein DCX29_00385 [Hyphomonas sp.]|nr:hypothetical protein [Hyphomonas sp.]